jgi:hypothetical protein
VTRCRSGNHGPHRSTARKSLERVGDTARQIWGRHPHRALLRVSRSFAHHHRRQCRNSRSAATESSVRAAGPAARCRRYARLNQIFDQHDFDGSGLDAERTSAREIQLPPRASMRRLVGVKATDDIASSALHYLAANVRAPLHLRPRRTLGSHDPASIRTP